MITNSLDEKLKARIAKHIGDPEGLTPRDEGVIHAYELAMLADGYNWVRVKRNRRAPIAIDLEEV